MLNVTVYLGVLVVAVLFTLVSCADQIPAVTTTRVAPKPANKNPLEGVVFDEIVVESNLNVRKKSLPLALRRQRSPLDVLIRAKRQFNNGFPQQSGSEYNNGAFQNGGGGFGSFPGFGGGFNGFNNPNYGSSASSANANSHSQGFGPNGFGAAAAGAQAQGFQTNGPFGGFGASAANSDTQSFQFGPNGFQGAGGLSGSQVYQLPNGHSINLAYTDGFSVGPDGRPTSANSNSITYNRR